MTKALSKSVEGAMPPTPQPFDPETLAPDSAEDLARVEKEGYLGPRGCPNTRGTILGIPILRITISWGLDGLPIFLGKLPHFGRLGLWRLRGPKTCYAARFNVLHRSAED